MRFRPAHRKGATFTDFTEVSAELANIGELGELGERGTVPSENGLLIF